MTISFHVPGKAIGKSMRTNPRTMRRYKTKETKAWMRLISDLARRVAPPRPWDGPIELVIEVTRAPLKTSKAKVAAMLSGRILPTTKPDNDNYCKGVADALTGIVYVDDAQVVRTVIEKKYGTVEGTQITVSRWARGVRW